MPLIPSFEWLQLLAQAFFWVFALAVIVKAVTLFEVWLQPNTELLNYYDVEDYLRRGKPDHGIKKQ